MKVSILGILLLFAVMIVLGTLGALKTRSQVGSYRRRQLMTENEREFFDRLRTGLPDHLIFPQVAMSAIIEASSADQKKAHSDRLRIAQQRVDFLIVNMRGDIVVVVELDDRTHSAEKDRVRDERLLRAGVKTVRFQSRNKPTPDAIRAAIFPLPLPTSDGQIKPVTA